MCRDVGFRFRHGQAAVEAPAPDRAERIALHPFRSPGQPDLIGMAEIEGKLRRGRITPDRLDLETAQHDFLQPRRIIGAQSSRRMRIAPQPAPHAAQRLAFAERPHARGEEVKQHAERKQIAARIVADAEQALRRHVGRGAVGHAKFFLQQIRQMIVMRQAEIDQHGLASRAFLF